ncbi:MAG: hypothetical protein DCF18_01725 [Cyanobium sp.]|nr:MAG: hypothetical protein DCF18_01725 [Cyanobium sp.]
MTIMDGNSIIAWLIMFGANYITVLKHGIRLACMREPTIEAGWIAINNKPVQLLVESSIALNST